VTTLRVLGRVVVNLLLVVVTLGGIAYLAPSLLGYERYVITGGSMSGSIERGSLVFAQHVSVDQLAVGDVITYLPPADSGVETLVTHRIVSARKADSGSIVFRTQGDANADPDPWRFSLTGQSQAVVSYSVPVVGYAFIALADRETRMLVVGLPACLVGLASLVRLGQAIRPRRAPTPHPFTA
jgi:signal peptidase